jgi:hypothetical protein
MLSQIRAIMWGEKFVFGCQFLVVRCRILAIFLNNYKLTTKNQKPATIFLSSFGKPKNLAFGVISYITETRVLLEII